MDRSALPARCHRRLARRARLQRRRRGGMGGLAPETADGCRALMSFDALAPHYLWMEWLLAGRKLQRCRTAFLDEARAARDILLLGEGNGRFLQALLQVNRTAN